MWYNSRVRSIDQLWTICLFVGFRPIREFLSHLKTSPLEVKGWKYWVILGYRGFFKVPHLLWHGPTLYNGHLRGRPVTLTHLLPRVWQWNCHYLFKILGLSRLGIKSRFPSTTTPPLRSSTLNWNLYNDFFLVKESSLNWYLQTLQ